MSNVKAFVEGKQHLKTINPQRQAVGNQHRVLIPPTKFNRAISSSVDHRPNTFPLHVGPSRQASGFDTDAESLEDTTTINVSEKLEGPPQLDRSLTSSKWTSTRRHVGSRNLLDSSRGKEGLSQPEYQSNASVYNEGCSNESDGDSNQDPYSVTHLISDFGSEEFANFKKLNVLDMNLIQNVQHSAEPATEIGIAASSKAPARTQCLASLSFSKSPPPIRHHAAFAADIMLRNSDMLKIENPSLTANSQHGDSIDQNSKRPFVDQYGVPPVSAESTRQPSDHAAYPSPNHMGADRASGGAALKPPTVAKQQTHKKVRNRPASSLLHNHGLSSSELSEDENMEKVTASELNQDNLKRSRSLDHDPDQLASMTFQQLQDECFDKVPVPGTSAISSERTKAFLHKNLENLSLMRDSVDQDGQQQAFFDNLTIDQYGESGAILGQKLSELIAKISSIRKQKRKVAVEFESEIAKREQHVRIKAAALKKEKIVMTRQTEELTTGRPS